MDFREYQALAGRTEKMLDTKGRLQHALLGILSEGGELADTIKKHVIYGQPLDVENLKEEIGDLFWYPAVIANALGLDLGEIAKQNIEKLKKRFPGAYTDAHAAARLDKKE